MIDEVESTEERGDLGAGEELPRMTLIEHLEELRKRLVWSLIILFIGFMGCFAFAEQIADFLAQPVYEALAAARAERMAEAEPTPQPTAQPTAQSATPSTGRPTSESGEAPPPDAATAGEGSPSEPATSEPSTGEPVMSAPPPPVPDPAPADEDRLAVLGVPDAFVIYVKVALTASLFLTSPFLFFQFWAFVSPGLYRRERLALLPFAILSSLFFLGGAVFAYEIAFPMAVEFLIGVGKNFQVVVTAERYFRFLLFVLLGLGVMFQLPIVVVLLARLGLVTPAFLLRHFRWAVLIIFVMAAILTPTPDVVNLCVFALPTLVLYLVGVAGAAIFGKKPKKEVKEADAPA